MLNPLHEGDEVLVPGCGICKVLQTPDDEFPNPNALPMDVITLGDPNGRVLEAYRHELT